MKITRRAFIKGSIALTVPLITGMRGNLKGVLAASAAEEKIFNPLLIPPILEDKNPDPDVADFDLAAQKSTTAFFKDKKATQTFGYNGNFLGPTIRAKKGKFVNLRVKNLLDEETTVHWHGFLVPGEMDGGTHHIIKPGDTWHAYFTVDNPAGTFWYHPHPLHTTGRQVYYGLAGFFIIDDEESENLNLPKNYGVNDIPLVIQDRRFAKDGSLLFLTRAMDKAVGMLGDTILVNGVVNPVLEVGTAKMRFRILNGSNARIYNFHLSDGGRFTQIASDAGFLETPLEMNSLVLSPAERAEIIIDFSKYSSGDVITLQSKYFNLLQSIDIMRFVVSKRVGDKTEIPKRLTTIEKIPPESSVKTRRFDLMGMSPPFKINGKEMDMERIDEVVKLGDTEIWEIRNVADNLNMMMSHPWHVHGAHFQILDRNGKSPPPNERGWKDTVLVYPGETVRTIQTFNYEATYPLLYMYHCHILEHEDNGMMGQFEVR